MEIMIFEAGMDVSRFFDHLDVVWKQRIHSVNRVDSILLAEQSLNCSNPDFLIIESNRPQSIRKWLESLSSRQIDFVLVSQVPMDMDSILKLGARDFLCTDCKFRDFEKMLNRMYIHLKGTDSFIDGRKALVSDALLLWEIDKRRPIEIEQILKIKSDGSYSEIYLKGEKMFCSSKNLGLFENLLRERQFMRIHHSCLVNLRHVQYYKPGMRAFVALSDNGGIEYVSKSKKREFLNRFHGNGVSCLR